MKILKFAVKPKSSIQQHLWDILALKNKIYISKELSPISQSLTWSQKDDCSFPAIIRIAFGNEVSLTPKLISSLKRATFSFFFRNKYCLVYLLFILSSKRSISIRMELKNSVERFETSRLNSTGTCSWRKNCKRHVTVHGVARMCKCKYEPAAV